MRSHVQVRTSLEVFYFQDSIPVNVILSADGRLEKQAFLQMWKSISDSNEQVSSPSVDPIPFLPPPSMK